MDSLKACPQVVGVEDLELRDGLELINVGLRYLMKIKHGSVVCFKTDCVLFVQMFKTSCAGGVRVMCLVGT